MKRYTKLFHANLMLEPGAGTSHLIVKIWIDFAREWCRQFRQSLENLAIVLMASSTASPHHTEGTHIPRFYKTGKVKY